ncbi:MAG TPA: CopD family protein [Thermodesulfobacteriota bacterium]|nr:CopD family protein [Thermodesulfobacteriota bacterium]
MRLPSKICLWILIGLFLIVFPFVSHSTPEYAEQTGRDCKICHVEATGGDLTKAGEDFREDLRIKGTYRPLHPFQRVVRLIIGYLHLLTAIAWFGTILYVHILLKPAYAAKGLPKGELILGWLGIILLSITGVPLTIARIPAWDAFYTTRFGILLSIKIILFLIMVATATIVTFVIGPKLRKRSSQAPLEKKTRLTLEELSRFDGSEMKPAYIAYKGKIYDVSSSKLWVEGNHVRKHPAGNDLTEALRTAPHDEDKILGMPLVGELITSETKVQKPAHEKVFYFMAYMNLVFVFLITFVIALWKWG